MIRESSKPWRARYTPGTPRHKPHVRMWKAAPEMCRALLKNEGFDDGYDYHGVWVNYIVCRECGEPLAEEHLATCWIDIALNKAGLDTKEKRDQARVDIGVSLHNAE